MTSTTETQSIASRGLDIAAKLATVAIAILAIVGAFVATLNFVIHSDTAPRFNTIETRLVDLEQSTAQRFDAVDQRFDAVDQRLDRMNTRLDGMDQHLRGMDQHLSGLDKRFNDMDQRLARIEELLMSNR